MKVKVYRIQDRTTKKFKLAGSWGGFSAVGKIWNKIGHLKSAITNQIGWAAKYRHNGDRIEALKDTQLIGCDIIEYELTEINRKSIEDFERDGGF